jgi:hypothetical protein
MSCCSITVAGEKGATLVQKLGQLRPLIAVFPQECMAKSHLLGQHDTCLAKGAAKTEGNYMYAQ